MEDKFILELLQAFDSSSAVSLKLQKGDCSISLKKEDAFANKVSVPVNQVAPVNPVVTQVPQVPVTLPVENTASQSSSVSSNSQNEESANVIKSPIVGTFYRAPSPDAPVYCEVGKSIKKGQPLCILEAMKMMNTLEAEYDCVIEEILVANGELVEFDQPIFKVKKV